MKRSLVFLLLAVLVLAFPDLLRAQCPEDPNDLGECDTLHVVPWPKTDTCFVSCFMESCDTICINNSNEHFPCFLYVNLLVTHDSNTFYWESEDSLLQDSIAAFVLPLAWTRTNPAVYCSLSGHWNENAMSPYDPRFPRSIWRHFHASELDSNRMAWLAGKFQGLEWSTIILNMTSDSSWYYFVSGLPPHAQDDSVYTPPRMWLTMIRSGSNREWWEGDRTLLATFTFRLEDSTTICIDSTSWPIWPQANHLVLTRLDSKKYCPRSNLPICFRVYDGTVVIVSEEPEGPKITVNPLTVDFDSVEAGDSSDTVITITNSSTGDADLVIYSIGVATGVFQLEDTSIAPIAPGASDSFKVIFAPSGNGLLKTNSAASETALFEDTISISSNAVAGDSVVSLGGVGILSTGVRWIEDSAEEEGRPTSFSISQNYPNPFNPATEFKFDLPRDCHVKIEIFNILGQKVKTLADEEMGAGSYVADWDGRDHRGLELSSGIYFYRMRAGDFSDVRKMILLK